MDSTPVLRRALIGCFRYCFVKCYLPVLYVDEIQIRFSQSGLTPHREHTFTAGSCRMQRRNTDKKQGVVPNFFPDMEMNIWKQQMHGAIGAFLSEIPATSRFSMNFESNTLEIRVHFQMAPTENAHKEPKKKAPPSKVKRNRRRLAKFLEKPETQPDLPPITSCEKSSEGEEPVAPPLLTPFTHLYLCMLTVQVTKTSRIQCLVFQRYVLYFSYSNFSNANTS